MSKSKNNPLTSGMTGKLGGVLVFRNVGGEIVVAVAPRKRKRKPSQQQKIQRDKFRMASAYANGQLGDPAALALYTEVAERKQYKSPRTLAIADYFHAPVITLVDTLAYTGSAGTKIVVHADDELEVKTVSIEVVNAAGVSIEKGMAVQRQNSTLWEYTATAENATLAGTRLLVKATDRPTNAAWKEVVL
jgi:hypothetical protein